MIIDKALIESGIGSQLLTSLINKHMEQGRRLEKLTEYYLGKHAVMNRPKNDGLANNRVVSNYAKYITQTGVAYFLGNPITYSCSEDMDIEPLKNCFLEQKMSLLDVQLAKQASICGKAIEMVYVNSEAKPKSCILPASQAFVVYDDSVEKNKLFGVHYYTQQNLDGTAGRCVATVADANYIYTFSAPSSFNGLIEERVEPHYFGKVPFIEYLNNDEEQGDFEQQISLIDAYNTLMSDRVNDKEQFVDAFLLLLGIDIDSAQAKALKREKVLCGEQGGKAEYLSKVLNEADTDVLRKAISEEIHKQSFVPDLTDEKFSGNQAGVALKYKLLGFDQATKHKERFFEKGIGERIELYMNFLNVKQNVPIVPIHKIDIEFHRSLPANELEIAQMVSMLSQIVSDETLLSRLPFVTDAKEEKRLVEKERKEKEETAFQTAFGYNKGIVTSSGDEDEE